MPDPVRRYCSRSWTNWSGPSGSVAANAVWPPSPTKAMMLGAKRGGRIRSGTGCSARRRTARLWTCRFRLSGRVRPSPDAGRVFSSPRRGTRVFLDGAVCTASQPGRDAGTGPERAADSLEATCYVSSGPVKRGDWWQIEFAEPVSGQITVKSGTRDGENRISSARVETSADGRGWTPAGLFQRASGECSFVPSIACPLFACRVGIANGRGSRFA